MAIYDSNSAGTTVTEIGLLYDSNSAGTTVTQIGKVYDYNGSSTTLIYSDQETVYPGATPTTKTYGGGTASGMTVTASNTSGGYAMAWIPVYCTGWDTLTVTWKAQTGTYALVYVGLKSAIDTTSGTWYIPSTTNSDSTLATGAGVNQTTATTTNINISALTGNHYLQVHVYAGSTADAVATASITSAIVS